MAVSWYFTSFPIAISMAPSLVNHHSGLTNGSSNHGVAGDSMNPHDLVQFDPFLKPKDYTIKGTDPSSKVLIRDVNIIDSTGADPFRGDVYIEGEPEGSSSS